MAGQDAWRVVYDRVLRRAAPSTNARMVGVEERGAVVLGSVVEADGVSWLRTATGAEVETFMMIDGARLGLGRLLTKVEPNPRGPACNQMVAVPDSRSLQVMMENQRTQAHNIQELCTHLDRLSKHMEARMLQVQVEQQSQAQQLSEVSARVSCLADEVSDLRHRATEARVESSSLRHCLLDTGVLESSLLQQRRCCQACLELLKQALEEHDAVLTLRQLIGETELQRSFSGLRAACHSLRRAGRRAESSALLPLLQPKRPSLEDEVDERTWAQAKKHEPSESTLEAWKASASLQSALGVASLQGTLGRIDAVHFNDVYRIFSLLGFSINHFVNRFTQTPRNRQNSAARELAGGILRRWRSDNDGTLDALKCRDLYRLLELLGYPLQRCQAILEYLPDCHSPTPLALLQFGTYSACQLIGRGGMTGAGTYLGEHGGSKRKVAIKWPVKHTELSTCKTILAKESLGLPKLVDTGFLDGKPYIVTELLGSSLLRVFQRMEKLPQKRKWEVLRVAGRLVLRRLQALHESGYVHCDVAPGNVLLGPARGGGGGGGGRGGCCGPLALYLIDFEHVQRYPGGKKLELEVGSAEWSSIRSAAGGERLPEDDVEALGWVLLHGLLGSLPWVDWLGQAYKDWGSKWVRHQAIKQVQRAKQQLLQEEKCFGVEMKVTMPTELRRFLRSCAPSPGCVGKPDYEWLSALLGGSGGPASSRQAEEAADLAELAECLGPLLP